jgi:ABC-2 type transport system permease protein
MFLLISKNEYMKRVRKKSFMIGTLIFPVIFGVIIAITIYIIEKDVNKKPLGFIDHIGLLESNPIDMVENYKTVAFIEFPNQEKAKQALINKEIQAYVVIPKNYFDQLDIDLYYWDEQPDQSVLSDFNDLIRSNLLQEGSNQLQARIIEGIDFTIKSVDSTRTFDEDSGFISILFPMAVALFFIFAVMGASGYFLQAITDEKENRTMEIVITSISPLQLIGGKSLGLIAVAFTQVVIWLSTIFITLSFLPMFFPELQGYSLPWGILIVFIIFFIPSFVFISGIMTAIGGAVTELQEGQQIAGLLNLFFTFPLFMTALVVANPDNPFLIFLSFWPTTSFLMMTLRWGFTVIPIWQIVLSWIILVLCGIITLWAASRIFRFGMLNYGKRLSLKIIIQVIRS